MRQKRRVVAGCAAAETAHLAHGTAHQRADARDQLAPFDRLGQIVVGAQIEAGDPVVELVEAGEDDHRRRDLRGAQLAQDFVAGQVGQQQVEQDDVVGVLLEFLDAFGAEARHVTGETLGAQHQRDAVGGRGIVLDKQHIERHGPSSLPGGGIRLPSRAYRRANATGSARTLS